MICRKCNSPGTLIIRKEYCYCVDCFNININHKFRACIGKNKIISANDKILICLSGNPNSTVLLDLIHTSISLNNHKKLRIFPNFLHVVENDAAENIKDSVLDQCKKYNFDVEIVHMEKYTKNNNIFNPNDTFMKKSDYSINVNVPATIKYDVKKKLKQCIFLEIAKKLQCKIIFTAETTSILATRLLSNLAIGRGSQVENDIGFVDNRDGCVKILRPMKDISNEEIEQYIKINKLKPSNIKHEKENSLQSVIQTFVLDLQENYPATISTICKTADKMSSHDNFKNQKKCTACQSTMDINRPSLTAVDATMFSKTVSFNKCGEESNIDDVLNNEDNTMFPFIYDSLCYCCSRNYAELQDCKQKHHVVNFNK